MKVITSHIDQIRKLCASNKVKSLFAFGSVVRNDFSIESDIDLIVEIDEKEPFAYSENYFNLKFQLEKLLNRKIDLLEQQALNSPILKDRIDQSKILIYGS